MPEHDSVTYSYFDTTTNSITIDASSISSCISTATTVEDTVGNAWKPVHNPIGDYCYTSTVPSSVYKLLVSNESSSSEKNEDIPKPKLIRQRGRAVIVTWQDDTKTTVVREDDSPDNLFLAFCAALAKKLYGSTNNVIKAFNAADERRMKEEEAKRKAKEEAQRLEAEKLAEKEKHRAYEADVKKRQYELQVELAAMRRLDRANAKKEDA